MEQEPSRDEPGILPGPSGSQGREIEGNRTQVPQTGGMSADEFLRGFGGREQQFERSKLNPREFGWGSWEEWAVSKAGLVPAPRVPAELYHLDQEALSQWLSEHPVAAGRAEASVRRHRQRVSALTRHIAGNVEARNLLRALINRLDRQSR